MPHNRHSPLLKNEPAPNSYGATGSSSGLEAGTANSGPEESKEWFSSSTKQIIAGSAVLLSGGMKVAEFIVTKSYLNHGLFEPVLGMVIISWILIYMLQLDYIYMLGHTPTDEDPTGYAAARGLALSKTYKFVTLHILLAVWQLFSILKLPIWSLVSICLTFLLLTNMYWQLHNIRPDKDRETNTSLTMTTSAERQNTLSPSFIQGPISSLLIMTATIWMPSAIIDVMLLYYPQQETLHSFVWPFTLWLLFINFIGSHCSTRVGYIANKRNVTDSAFHATTATPSEEAPAPRANVAVGTDVRLVPVDLAGVLGLFWVSVAIAAGPGSVNDGSVVIVGYISAAWQALSVIGAIV